MRTIKFRGKRLDNGEWVAGYYWRIGDGHRIRLYDTGVDYPVDPETVGQYTGLQDKNGKEIYEGDVVISTHLESNKIGEVMWDAANLTYNVKYGEHLSNLKLKPYVDEGAPFEIIGNIYENPRASRRG